MASLVRHEDGRGMAGVTCVTELVRCNVEGVMGRAACNVEGVMGRTSCKIVHTVILWNEHRALQVVVERIFCEIKHAILISTM